MSELIHSPQALGPHALPAHLASPLLAQTLYSVSVPDTAKLPVSSVPSVACEPAWGPAARKGITMAVLAPHRPQCGKHVLRLLRRWHNRPAPGGL